MCLTYLKLWNLWLKIIIVLNSISWRISISSWIYFRYFWFLFLLLFIFFLLLFIILLLLNILDFWNIFNLVLFLWLMLQVLIYYFLDNFRSTLGTLWQVLLMCLTYLNLWNLWLKIIIVFNSISRRISISSWIYFRDFWFLFLLLFIFFLL